MVRRGRLASPTRFNPRTRVGCDEWSQTSQCRNHWFQSTHPRGVRLPVMRRRFQPHHVSIHAPAWGTTLRQTSGQRLDSCFNPRTRVGCDCGCWCGPTASSRFNPRTRVGCDPMKTPSTASTWSFNPRTRVGCDMIPSLAIKIAMMFQSTHPRGVRRNRGFTTCRTKTVSIHAPAWGATIWERPQAVRLMRFNPRTRVGCDDDYRTIPSGVSGVSIHAPAWGATRWACATPN